MEDVQRRPDSIECILVDPYSTLGNKSCLLVLESERKEGNTCTFNLVELLEVNEALSI